MNEILTKRDRIIQKLWPVLTECYTRTQNNNFKNRIKNIASIQPAFLEMIYQELVLNLSAASHAVTVQIISAMLFVAEGLVANLHHLNPRRPGNKYNVFFAHMNTLIEE